MHNWTGKKHTEESKQKIAASQTARHLERMEAGKELRLKTLFVKGKLARGQILKKWLIFDGYKLNECEVCYLDPVWEDKPLVLEVDHKNGDRMDNRIENLRIICPNCHSQTDTYKWKNSRTVKSYSVRITTDVLS